MSNFPNPTSKRNELTAQEFISLMTSTSFDPTSEYFEERDFGHKKEWFLCIRNLVVNEEIDLTQDVSATHKLLIEDVSFSKFKISGGQFPNELHFENVTFNKSLIINDGNFPGEIKFEKSKFVMGISFRGGRFSNFIKFNDCISSIGIALEGGNFFYGLSFSNCTLSGIGLFRGEYRLGIVFGECKFINGLTITGGEVHGSITISNSTFQNGIEIYPASYDCSLHLRSNTIKGKFEIHGGSFAKELKIESSSINEVIIKNLSAKLNLFVDSKTSIETLRFSDIILRDSLIRLSGQYSNVEITDVQNFGNIVFNEFSAKQVSPLEKARQLQASLLIKNSDIGKATFINSDLTGFAFYIHSSKITDSFVVGTKMPVSIQSESTQQIQLGYSQLKKVYESRGDKIEANRYFAKEMNAYYSTLTYSDDFWEKSNLWLNKISTNHGQSWKKGLLSTFLVSGLFYLLYCLFLGFFPSFPTWLAVKQFGTILSYFLEFINPIHKANYIAQQLLGEDSPVSGWARTVEGISRIFIAYFVYQLIQAFRKHGKSSG